MNYFIVKNVSAKHIKEAHLLSYRSLFNLFIEFKNSKKRKFLNHIKNNSFILLLLNNNYSISKTINMIANITTILYILSVSDEIINNGTLQKGTAVSRVDEYEGLQI